MLALMLGACLLAGCQRNRQEQPVTGSDEDPDASRFLGFQTQDPRLVQLSDDQRARVPIALPPPTLVEHGERSTLVYPVRQSRVESLALAVEGLLTPQGTLAGSADLNALVMTDETGVIRTIQQVLESVDQAVPQVLVEARVVEVTVDNDLEYEIRHLLTLPAGDSFVQGADLSLDTPGASPLEGQGANLALRPFAAEDFLLDTFVRLLVSRGRAKILSSPNLIVSAGSEASIITGQEVPVQSATVIGNSLSTTTEFKRVGIKLRVLLLQISGDSVRLELNPEVSTVTGFTTTGTVEGQLISNPIIAIRNVTSTLTLKDGEILTVGGLLSSEDRLSTRGIPVLQDIPVLGALFQSRRREQVRTQLIFFLRVHILPEAQAGQIRVARPDQGMRVLDRLANPTTMPADPPAQLDDPPIEPQLRQEGPFPPGSGDAGGARGGGGS